MEAYGLPYVHIMAALMRLNIDELPSCLVLERWTIAVKDRFVGMIIDDASFWNSHVIARYVWMLNACREFCTLACQSANDFVEGRNKSRKEIQNLKYKNGIEVGTGWVERCVGGLQDPTYVRTKGSGCKKSRVSKLRIKRIVKCSACKLPGHNKLACTTVNKPDAIDDNVLASCSFDGEDNASPMAGDFNVDVIGVYV